MVTTAMGCIISEPMPTPSASVSMPRIVVMAVIRIGRRRTRPVSSSALRLVMPAIRIWLTESTNTMPLLTTTPISTRKPIIATMERSMPVSSSAIRPPVNASGIVNSTMNGDLNDWNCATIIRKISTSATAIMNTMSPMISLTVSFSPESVTS